MYIIDWKLSNPTKQEFSKSIVLAYEKYVNWQKENVDECEVCITQLKVSLHVAHYQENLFNVFVFVINWYLYH